MAVRSENSLNSVQAAIFAALNGNVTWDSSNVPVYDLSAPWYRLSVCTHRG